MKKLLGKVGKVKVSDYPKLYFNEKVAKVYAKYYNGYIIQESNKEYKCIMDHFTTLYMNANTTCYTLILLIVNVLVLL